MKNLNNQIQAFAGNVANEASTIFGDASGIFNDLKSSLGAIVKGGPDQQGWGAAETNAVNTQIMEQAAANARNVKAAAGNAAAAIGGGNVPTVSGLETAVDTAANLGVEQQKAQQLSQATVQNYETGRQNYFEAVKGEAALPNVFNTPNQANQVADTAYQNAEKSQQSVDSANNWWQPLVMAGIGAGASFLTGGFSSKASGGNFLKGATGSLNTEVQNNGVSG